MIPRESTKFVEACFNTDLDPAIIIQNFDLMTERKTSSTNFRNQSFLEEKCSLNELLDLVSKRWFSDVLFCIQEGNNRFKLIKDDLKYISDTILSDRLKLLERYNLITRTDFDEIPPKVEYALTEKGEELSELLEKMCEFSDILMAEVRS
jgi:DNA-binding HxlR family transcriptional regulator